MGKVLICAVIFAIIACANARGIAKRDVHRSCPTNAKGEYPNCVCESGSQFNEIHNICPGRPLESLAGSCPDDSSGVFPNCVCRLGKVYDHQHSICLDIDRTKCPKRSVGTPPKCDCEEGYKLDDIHWYCRPWYLNETGGGHFGGEVKLCPVFQIWNYKIQQCEPIRCPNDRTRFYPDCTTYSDEPHRPVSCPVGQNYTIEKPYCHCPDDQDYTYPVCHERCPPNTYFELKSKTCVKRPCPVGWDGDYYPYCTIGNFQKCPEEFPGVWPNCNIYDEGPRLQDRNRKLNYV